MIKIIITQSRGKDRVLSAGLSSPVIPRKGETVIVAGTEIGGRVADVTYEYIYRAEAPRVLDYVQVTLDGWKTGFGKD